MMRLSSAGGCRKPPLGARRALYSTAEEAAEAVAALSGGTVAARGIQARRSVGRARGQALVEFALTVPLFFFLLFFCLAAGFTTMERAAVVNATTAGARVAAGAASGASLNEPALAQAERRTVELLRPALLSTHVGTNRPGVECPAIGTVADGDAIVCASAPTADTVKVEVVARPAGFLPAAAGGLVQRIDLYAVVHTATFKR